MLPNGYGLATMHWSQSGGMTDITATCGFALPDPFLDLPNEVAETIESYWIAGDSPSNDAQMGADWGFTGVSVLLNPSGLLFAGTSYSNTAGGISPFVGPVPAYTPLVVTKRTNLAGVQYRGRMYPPYTKTVSSNVSDLGVIASGALTEVQDLYDNLFVEWSSGGYPPVLLHNAPETGGTPTPTVITSFQVQPVIAIQRRRKNR